MIERDPDGAAMLAERYYTIYRGMTREPLPPPAHWKDLRRETQAAFVFVARMAMLHVDGERAAEEKDNG